MPTPSPDASPEASPDPARVAVLGAGTMGRGIAQLALQAGHRVTLVDPQEGAAERARSELAEMFAMLERKGRLEEAPDALLARLEPATDLAAAAGASWAIEAAPERLELKREIFRELDALLPEAVLATNTSTLSVTAIAAAAARPERVVGLHFFNPAPLMPLVEVVAGAATSAAVLERAAAFARALGRTPVVARDAPGFIVNRVARPFYDEGLRLHAEGIPAATLDALLRAAGFRMGPLELMDLIGIDVSTAAAESVYEAFYGEPRLRPHPLRRRMLAAGWLGRKSGRGFYVYPREERGDDAPPAPTGTAPRTRLVGPARLTAPFTAAFPGAGDAEGDADLVIDLQPGCPRPEDARARGSRDAAPRLRLGWGASASVAVGSAGGGGPPLATFSLLPPFDATTVELMSPVSGENAATALAQRFFAAHGRRAVEIPDRPGGATFRIVAMLVNEAASAVAEGLAAPGAIDTAMRLGTNYPHGPLEWSQRIGIAHLHAGLAGIADETGDGRYAPHPLLTRMAAAGIERWAQLGSSADGAPSAS